MDRTAKFIVDNLRTIMVVGGFVIGFYIQYQLNVAKVNQLENDVVRLNGELETQYAKLDAIKLDKSVFEASSKQWASMSQDIREIRNVMENFMQSEHIKYHKQ